MGLYNEKKYTHVTFCIKLSSKLVGVGLNFALLKDNWSGDPRFFFFFLKCKMIVHDIKTTKYILMPFF